MVEDGAAHKVEVEVQVVEGGAAHQVQVVEGGGGAAHQVEVEALRLQQVLIKPRKTAGVQREGGREGGLLSLVNIKSTHPPLPVYDTLVTGMVKAEE